MTNFFLILLYEISLWILMLIAFPKFIYDYVMHKKYRHNIKSRLGIDLPNIKKITHPVIWLHAVSLGETKAIVALSREIKTKFPEGTLIISSITETGHQEAKKSIPTADYHIYLPFDFNFLAKRIIKRFSPDLVILSESDFWFNFLRHAKKNGASIALVNGKISERSARRFAKFSFFAKPLFDLFDLFCLQNTLYLERFIHIGVSRNRICVTGNLKLDDDYPSLNQEEIQEWKQKLHIQTNDPILTIGSTHDPEELLLMEALHDVWKKIPNLKVLLIPRHPERYAEAGKILEKMGIPWINYRDLDQSSNNARVIILNVMGLLRIAYQLSTLSVVGGSFTSRIGGHNILEPCWYGKPVLFGPYMHTQTEFVDYIKKYNCGLQIDLAQLSTTLVDFLSNPVQCEQFGSKGIAMMKNLKGATNTTMIALEPIFKKITKKSSNSLPINHRS